VAKEGERVSPKLAEILARLEIYPVMEGLNLCAVYDREGEVLFTPDILHIDHSKYFSDVMEAVRKSSSLALNIAYPTRLTIKPLLHIAYSHARNLSINASIYEQDTIFYFISKAYLCSKALANVISVKDY
jgi:large subunit ribosomal protein L10